MSPSRKSLRPGIRGGADSTAQGKQGGEDKSKSAVSVKRVAASIDSSVKLAWGQITDLKVNLGCMHIVLANQSDPP